MSYSNPSMSSLPSFGILAGVAFVLHGDKRFDILSRLGSGSFGEVNHVTSANGHEYALKSMNPSQVIPADKIFRLFHNEASIHEIVSGHPHILPYHGKFVASGTCHLLSGMCKGGNLGSYIQDWKFFDQEDYCKLVFGQIVSAVRHCHDKGIAHRDLKPDNILVSDEEGEIFYVSDFGLSTRRRFCSHFGAGTGPYMAPETFKRDLESASPRYDAFAADVWALGIILFEMATSTHLWECALRDDRRYWLFIHEPEMLQNMFHLTDDFANLLKRMLEPLPHLRISLEDVIEEVCKIPHFIVSGWRLEPSRVSTPAPQADNAKEQSLHLANRSSVASQPALTSNTAVSSQPRILSQSCASSLESTACSHIYNLRRAPKILPENELPGSRATKKASRFVRLLRKLKFRI